jgi:hypothetical protein
MLDKERRGARLSVLGSRLFPFLTGGDFDADERCCGAAFCRGAHSPAAEIFIFEGCAASFYAHGESLAELHRAPLTRAINGIAASELEVHLPSPRRPSPRANRPGLMQRDPRAFSLFRRPPRFRLALSGPPLTHLPFDFNDTAFLNRRAALARTYRVHFHLFPINNGRDYAPHALGRLQETELRTYSRSACVRERERERERECVCVFVRVCVRARARDEEKRKIIKGEPMSAA